MKKKTIKNKNLIKNSIYVRGIYASLVTQLLKYTYIHERKLINDS